MEASTKNRPVRRVQRQITKEEAIKIIEDVPHAVLSSADASGVPYGVPVSPVWFNGNLYFHCALEGGRRSENLKQNPEVSICFIARDTTLQENFSVDYASAIVSGRAEMVTDTVEFAEAFKALLDRHCPDTTNEQRAAEMKKALRFTALWKIVPDSITGKARRGAYPG